MNVRKELFVGLCTALATAAGLFTLQLWVSSYIDTVSYTHLTLPTIYSV